MSATEKAVLEGRTYLASCGVSGKRRNPSSYLSGCCQRFGKLRFCKVAVNSASPSVAEGLFLVSNNRAGGNADYAPHYRPENWLSEAHQPTGPQPGQCDSTGCQIANPVNMSPWRWLSDPARLRWTKTTLEKTKYLTPYKALLDPRTIHRA